MSYETALRADAFQMFAGFAELAQMLGVTRETVKRWYRTDETFPNAMGSIDRHPAFHKESVRIWYHHGRKPDQVGEPGTDEDYRNMQNMVHG